jgi:MFS transporter, FHS family, L-fucose permease
MGICNKVAGFLAPIFIGLWVLQGIENIEKKAAASVDSPTRDAILAHFASVVYHPYLVINTVLLALAIGVAFSPLPEIDASQANLQPQGASGTGAKTSIFKFPHLWLGVLCIFIYVGVEVMAGDAIGTYAKGFQIPTDVTKFLTSATLIAMIVGYGIGMLVIPKYISQETALSLSAILGAVFSVLAFLTNGYVSVAFVAALGLANVAGNIPVGDQGTGCFY